MNIITGYMGTPHITSAQDRGQNQGCFGTGSYILDVGQQLAADIVSANEIRVRDGVLSHQGCVGIIEKSAYDSLEIANGSQDMQRIDLIVARYEKNAETSVESLTLAVIEGTAVASNPTPPSYNEGDIQAGDSPVDMPLYRVNINGVNIASTTLVAAKVKTQAELDSAVSELNSNVKRWQTVLLGQETYGSLRAYWNASLKIGVIKWTGNANASPASLTNLTYALPSYLKPVTDFTAPLKGGSSENFMNIRSDNTIVVSLRASQSWTGGTCMYPLL